MATLQALSTEFIYCGVTGDVPAVGAELAFMDAEASPESADWHEAIVVDDAEHALWADAVASGAAGDWYAAVLIGSFGTDGVELTAGDYTCWIRLEGTTERPVRIAPEPVEIQ